MTTSHDIDTTDTVYDIYCPAVGTDTRSHTTRWTLGYIVAMSMRGYDLSFRGDGVIISRRTPGSCYGPAGHVSVLAFCVVCTDPAVV